MFNNNEEPKVYKEIKDEETVEEKKGKDNKALLLIIVLVLVMVLLVIVYNLITNDTFKPGYAPKTTTHPGFKTTTSSSTSTTVITENTTTSTVQFTSSTTTTTTKPVQQKVAHQLKISHLSDKDKETYNLGPGKEAVVTMKNSKDKITVELTYNGMKVVTDTLADKSPLEVYTFGDAFIYINTQKGTKNYHKIYILTDLDKETFYEFHETDGMNPDKMSFQGNNFVVKASRMYDGTKVKYGDLTGIDICNDYNWTGGFTYSSIVETTYTFTLYNGVLNLKPVSSNKVTVQQFLDNNPGLCN